MPLQPLRTNPSHNTNIQRFLTGLSRPTNAPTNNTKVDLILTDSRRLCIHYQHKCPALLDWLKQIHGDKIHVVTHTVIHMSTFIYLCPTWLRLLQQHTAQHTAHSFWVQLLVTGLSAIIIEFAVLVQNSTQCTQFSTLISHLSPSLHLITTNQESTRVSSTLQTITPNNP